VHVRASHERTNNKKCKCLLCVCVRGTIKKPKGQGEKKKGKVRRGEAKSNAFVFDVLIGCVQLDDAYVS
jgi:hypothetical protein